MIRWATSRPAVVWAASLTILLGGVVAFTRLALATRTTVELPRLQISVSWPGAAAELVEMYVASPIEAAIQSIRGVKKTRSDSNEGSASLTVELLPNADVQIARLSILERLELLRPEFPPGVSRPTVTNYVPQELAEEPLLRLMVNGPFTAGTLQKLSREVLEPRLSAVQGVAGVDTRGGTDLGISVAYDASFLRQIGVSPVALATALDNARMVQSLGNEQRGTNEIDVTVRDQPQVVEDLEQLPVRGRGGRVFRLGELATVRPEEDARGFFFRIDGHPAIMLTVSRLPGADAIKTAHAVRAALKELDSRLPAGVRVSVRNDQSEDLATELRDLLLRGAIAFAAVILVIAVMLRDVRAVALVMGSAAVAIAGTALGLYIFKIPANMLTLAGLAMGIGILVQNGLVVAERLGTVADTRAARAEAASRITPAVIGATLTTAVVLFPFLYLQGDARAAFVPFAAAFSMALGWSVLSSVVMIPALARGHRIHEAAWPRMRRLYTHLLVGILRWRWATLTITVLALAGLTWVFVKKVPRFTFSGFGFGQRTTVDVRLNFPRGSDPATLDASMREMERFAVGKPGVEMVQTQSFGSTGAFMQVTFSKATEFSALPLEMEEMLTQRAVLIGGASVSVRGQGPGFASGMGSVGMATFRVRVLGYSFSGVERLAMDLQERLERIPRVRDVDISTTSFSFGREKAYAITIAPDRPALARFGLTSRDLASAVAREVSSPGAERIEIAGEEIPITVKAQGARERSLDELRSAMMPTPSGGSVPISAVSAVDEREALSAISREDQQYVRIVAYEFRGPNKLAQRTHNAFMASVSTPAGYKVEDAGFGFYEPDNSERGLWLVFAIGIVLVILSVALVFDSTWATAIVFLSLPIALGGVIAAFWIAKAAFTREAAVGVILVVGHAVNQAILVMDAALAKRHATLGGASRGLNAAQALRAARDRAGMIVLVTLSTLASLLPLAIGTQTNNLFGAIALAAAGGMLAGTLGALFVVPAMIVGRKRGPKSEVRGQRVLLEVPLTSDL